MRRRLLILLAILAAALPAGAQSRVTLSIGHSAPVTDMVTIPNRGVAVSAARDASLRVWDLERGALMESYQLPPIPVLRLAAHPDGEHLAVLQSDNRSHHQISVMAWATGDILYSVQVPARPIYFGYSPQGTYLLYSLPAYRSLFFLDSASGSERTYLNAGFGIVGFVQISASEQYVMTYIPSRGQIIYFELQTGGEEHRTSTERNLEHLTALSGRHLVGYRENTLYVVDNYDGSVEDSTPAVGVRSITVDGDQIVVLSQSGTRTEINRYTYSGTSLQRSYYRAIGLEPEPRVIRAVPRSDSRDVRVQYLVGTQLGALALYDRESGRETLFAPQPLRRIVDVGWTDGRLHLMTSDGLVTLVSDLLATAPPQRSRVSYARSTVFDDLPVDTVSGLTSTTDALYVWGPFEDRQGVFQLSPISGRATLLYQTEEEVPILSIQVTDEALIVVLRDGRILSVDGVHRQIDFEYRALSAQDAVTTDRYGVVVAKARSSSFDSSVVRIDPQTLETVAVRSPAFLSTKIIDAGNSLYSVGLVESAGGAVRTVLLRHSGARLDRTEEVTSVAREAPAAGVVYSPETQTVYSTLSDHGVIAYQNGRVQTLPNANHGAQRLWLAGRLLIALNSDGTLSFWNAETGEHLCELYLFDQAQWLVMGQRGVFLSSGTAPERYLTFLPGERSRLELSDFRLRFPVTLE